jgi:hypothetical protein
MQLSGFEAKVQAADMAATKPATPTPTSASSASPPSHNQTETISLQQVNAHENVNAEESTPALSPLCASPTVLPRAQLMQLHGLISRFLEQQIDAVETSHLPDDVKISVRQRKKELTQRSHKLIDHIEVMLAR